MLTVETTIPKDGKADPLFLLEKTNQKVKFTVKNQSGDAAVDLTGKTLRFSAKEDLRDLDADTLFEVEASITDATNGKAEADVLAASLPRRTRATFELSIWDAAPSPGDFPDDRILGPLEIRAVVVTGGFTT